MTLDIKKIGVIGCGQMGKGIAQVCAGAGFDVHLMDVNENAVKKAIPSIEKSLGRLVDKEKIRIVIDDFRDHAIVSQYVKEGGVEYAIRLVEKSFPPVKAFRLIRIL